MANEANWLGSDTMEEPVAGQPVVLSYEALRFVAGGGTDDSPTAQPVAGPTAAPLQPPPPTWPTW